MRMMQFRMVRITVGQFAILADSVPDGDISGNLKLSVEVAPEVRQVAVGFSWSFDYEESRLMLIDMKCEFQIRPEDWDKSVSDGKVTIPKSLVGILAAQTVGVARGVLYCKTEGTPFNGLILPPLNVSDAVESDIEVPVEAPVTE